MLQKRRQVLPYMQHSLSELLFPGYRRRVLALLLLHPAQASLAREISPKVYGTKEWARKRRAPDAFLREVLAKPRIFVIGTEHELGKPARA